MGRHRQRGLRPQPGIQHYWDTAAGSARAYALLSTITLAEGVALAVGGADRATAPSWRFVYAIGGPTWFGAGLIAISALMFAAPTLSAAVLRAGLMLAAIAHLTFAFAFAGAAIVDPRASLLAPALFAGIGLHQLSHREAYRGVT